MEKLTTRAKHYLLVLGYNKEDFADIENGRYRYFHDYNREIAEEKAIRTLGVENWLSGVARACFHRTAVRTCRYGNKIIYIERI